MDVLKLLSTGATNREIANELVITDSTVKIHVGIILDKLNLRNRREAGTYAQRHNLISNTDDVRSFQSAEMNND